MGPAAVPWRRRGGLALDGSGVQPRGRNGISGAASASSGPGGMAPAERGAFMPAGVEASALDNFPGHRGGKLIKGSIPVNKSDTADFSASGRIRGVTLLCGADFPEVRGRICCGASR